MTDYLNVISLLSLFPSETQAGAAREAACTGARLSNINSTVHITCQLVGRSVFLHGGWRGNCSLFLGWQCFLVEPVQMSESFTDPIIIFCSCPAAYGPSQPVWHGRFRYGSARVKPSRSQWGESSSWVTMRLFSRSGCSAVQQQNTTHLCGQKNLDCFIKSSKLRAEEFSEIPDPSYVQNARCLSCGKSFAVMG